MYTIQYILYVNFIQRNPKGSTTTATLALFCSCVFRISAAPNNRIIISKIKGKSRMNHAILVYPREQMKFRSHVQKTRKRISTINMVDVFATLQLTFPKQYWFVFSILSKSIPKRASTEIMK